jgi:hypothetical protein
MWSIPHCVVAQHLNSYTLEMLAGHPLSGLYNAKHLRIFKPHEGTKLAMDQLALDGGARRGGRRGAGG